MNSNSSIATGAAAISGAMLSGLIIWVCQIAHLSPPPAEVAGTIGALVLGGGHAAVNWLNARFPAVAPAKATVAPVAVPAPAPAAVPAAA